MRFFLARHGETVFNAAATIQGNAAHTPLTRKGIVQAEAMGAALACHVGAGVDVDIWASPAGRTQQTAAIMAEHLDRRFFGDIRLDARLVELDVGNWAGLRYADIVAQWGEIVCPKLGVFSVRPPAGEWYPDVVARLTHWLGGLTEGRNVLVVSHGLTLRLLRGLLAGGELYDGVPIAPEVPQGSIITVKSGLERRLTISTILPAD